MRLRRLAIRRLPGIPRPGFELDGFADGINVVVGPNASGKTSIPRAVRTALYGEEAVGEGVDVEAVFALGVREEEGGRAGDGNGTAEGEGERDGDGLVRAARAGGAPVWTRDGRRIEAPTLPEHRFVSCFTLHIEDLLTDDADTDADIARRLARELAGGYDLDAARDGCGFSVPRRVGQTEAREVSSAETDLRRRQGRYRELQRDEERLDSLERARDEAQEADREAALAERALQLLERRRERIGLEGRKAGFPPDMARLSGTEAEAIERLDGERRSAEEDRARAEAERGAAERALAATGLAGSALDEGAAADVRPRIARLKQLEGEIEHARARTDEAAAARDRAARALGGEPGEGVRLGPEEVHAMEAALGALRQAGAELREVEAEIGRLSGLPPEADPEPERIDEARRELLHWLSAPAAPGSPAARMAALLAVAAVGAAGALAAGLFFHPAAYALLVPVAAALACVYVLLRRAGAGAGRRREAEQRYHRLGLERPETWEREQVAERLHGLDRELGAARRRTEDLRRRREAERKGESLRAAVEREREKLRGVARRVNFDPEAALDASFDRWLRLTHDYDRADTALSEGRARLAALEGDSRALRDEVASFLAAHGEEPREPRVGVPEPGPPGARPLAAEAAPGATAAAGAGGSAGETMEEPSAAASAPAPASGLEPPAAEVLGQRLERLAGRIRRRDGAERDLRAARESLERRAGEIEKRRAETEAVFRGAGLEPGDEAELRRRLGFLEGWRSLDRRITEVRIAEDLLHRELAERADLLRMAEEGGEPALQGRLGALRERAARARGLSEEIAGIRARVELASKGRELEEARARRRQAGDSLHRRFDEAMLAEAGAFLLDQVESEHVRASRPAVLRRAEDWFARFTRHRFELAMGPAGGGTFRARETETGEWRALSELSTGTRMQLLLAVRVAFALEAEKGRTPLPLFLDEALTTADPDRFRAVADSLRRLSEEDGRQIFYLTAQPEEGRYWAEAAATVIDLAASRRAGRAVGAPEEVALPPAPPEPPHPEGMSPEEYAVRIGVDPVQPWGAPAGVHAFHLLRDDLDLLRRLLRTGVERVGSLDSLLDSGEAGLFLSPDEESALRLRIAGARAWIEAWREGRGRPVDREALAASGAVTRHFLDRLAELAGEAGGDARRLLEEMDEGAVPHFRDRNRQRLEEWLRENGYLGDTDPLDAHGVERRVAMTLTAHGASPEASLAEAADLARSMAAGLAAGREGEARAAADLDTPGGTGRGELRSGEETS